MFPKDQLWSFPNGERLEESAQDLLQIMFFFGRIQAPKPVDQDRSAPHFAVFLVELFALDWQFSLVSS